MIPQTLLWVGLIVAWLVVPGQMLVWAFLGYVLILLGRLGIARRGGEHG